MFIFSVHYSVTYPVTPRPTTVGTHIIRFETTNGGYAEVQVLVTNEAPVNNEVVIANNFTITLTEVASADFITLANAKGYDITDVTTPIEILVTEVTPRPTTVGIHTVRFETTNGGYAEVQVLVTNEAPINNEVVIAYDFTIELSNIATADFIALANAKGYDITSPANPTEIPVIMTTQKPTTIGNHTIHFETTNGGYADVIATIVDTNAYLEVNADNVIVDLKTVQAEIIHGTLESYILENANATATLHTSVESISLSADVLVADTKELENGIQVGVYDVEISTNYVIGEGRSAYSFEKYTNDTTQTISSELYSSKTITFEIINGTDNPDKTLPTTGQNNLEIMYIGLLILCGSIVVFIFLRRKPKNI